MKKAAISIITCICMLVGMLSFSLPVYASSYVGVPGSCFFYTYNSTVGTPALTVTFPDDALSGQSSSARFSSSLRPGISTSYWFRASDVKFFLNKTIPANSHVSVNLGIRYWASTTSNVNADSLTFTRFSASFNNPSENSAALPRWSVREYIKSGSYDKEAYFNLSFDTDAPITSINLTDVGADISVSGDQESYYIWAYLLDCRVQYALIDNNPNRDVLVDIKNNTQSTTDAVNDQTNTVTNGYDNSSMTSDNERLNNQIAQYDQAQESATNTSVSNIDAAEFVNPSSNASVFAAMTFSASFLQSLYNNLGDFGIVVMVSLSLCLGLMLVGWFKYRKGG